VCKRLEISEELVKEICKIGKKVPSKNHTGQWRYCSMGYCVVVDANDTVVVTIYKDKVITPLRPDQIEKGVQIKRKK
jgi:hypothetical protein